ncbi:formylglycine-generating enzyme family protein [Sorangium sp. So ce1024]|uniref:formylglycine-generating enzyme family protein n=1 Tax=Sorangium sp. So ce1024 TaxID=3133327 RepID=UPI003F0A2BFC
MRRRPCRAGPPAAPARRGRAPRRPGAAALVVLCGLAAACLGCDRREHAATDAAAPAALAGAGATTSAEPPPPDDAAAAPLDAAAPEPAPDGGSADGGAIVGVSAVGVSADGVSSDGVSADGGLPGSAAGCPDDMVLVEGDYCPLVQQICLKHHKEYEKDQARRANPYGEVEGSSSVSERCLEYRQPSVCLSKKRTPMRYCVDRYEWPNRKGELPALLVSWREAVKLCEGVGKRLCTEEEFNFACEGEEMLPYTYGYVRDATKCNIDRPFRQRELSLYRYERCMKDPKCKAELERLDQRVPAGSMPGCVSPFGVHDLNGNINEWVVRPGRKSPQRSGLKGGWWGPMRGRCRPTVGFHNEEDYGYEQGFRCCKDAAPR